MVRRTFLLAQLSAPEPAVLAAIACNDTRHWKLQHGRKAWWFGTCKVLIVCTKADLVEKDVRELSDQGNLVKVDLRILSEVKP